MIMSQKLFLLVVISLVSTFAIADILCPDGESHCPSAATCCSTPSGGYGCCPYANAQCCADQLHCCPNGYTCDQAGSKCVRPLLSQWLEEEGDFKSHVLSTLAAKQEQSVSHATTKRKQVAADPITCPGGKTTCPATFTCCEMGKLIKSYGCCPGVGSVCCTDGEHCCPSGYTCDTSAAKCSKSSTPTAVDLIFLDHADAQQVVEEEEVAMIKILPKPQQITCPDNTHCPNGTTCCEGSSGAYGCCPYDAAVCCADKAHCCPKGSTCDAKSTSCVGGPSSSLLKLL